MHSVAKATIIIPVIIILIASVLRFSRATYNSNTRVSNVAISVFTTPSPSTTRGLSINASEGIQSLFLPHLSGKSIDLKGPYVCSVLDIEHDINVFIKDKKIYVKYKTPEKTDTILLKEDCIYKWTNTEKQGMKVCGIDQYISIFDSLSSLPLFSTEVLFTLISNLDQSSGQDIDSDTIKKLVNSCEKQDIDNLLFILPSDIMFTEVKITGTPKELINELK